MGKIDYEICIEIYRGEECDYHCRGEKFRYPEDISQMCPWLLDSMSSMLRVLQFGGTLPWRYEGTEFEKIIDDEGETTEFVRCPDPTGAGIVAKICRKKLLHSREVGWA